MQNINQLSTPRSLKSQKTKEKIYKAAMDLLQDYGYEYITVNNICTLAEVSVGSFYHYFDSKDTLMSNFFIEAFVKLPKEELNSNDPIEDIIHGLCCYADFCESQGLDFIRHLYTPFNKSMDYRQSQNKSQLPLMNQAKEKLILSKKYFIDTLDPVEVAADLCTISKGCILEWCISEGSFNLRNMTNRILKNYLTAYLK